MNILIIACHPDDEVLGVGGTAFDLAEKGASIYYLIMTKAMAKVHGAEKIEEMREEAKKVHQFLPSSGTTFFDFPSGNIDTIPHRDIIEAIATVVNKVKPEIIFTHFWKDINKDHQLVSEATLVTTRPYASPFVRQVYCYEVMSCTEWSIATPSHAFTPICFHDISVHLENKLKAIEMYGTQQKEYPHTRSIKSVEMHARQRGSIVGVEAAECFYPVRLMGVPIL